MKQSSSLFVLLLRKIVFSIIFIPIFIVLPVVVLLAIITSALKQLKGKFYD